MGYAYYDTPHGPGGYGVEDRCPYQGCGVKIDRGLAYLCGDSPVATEIGCGKWFCSAHLYMTSIKFVDSLCPDCIEQDWEVDA
ncbi:MAG: hypothetical protein WC054_01345 [Candidatus Nanopelagicales bacterium]